MPEDNTNPVPVVNLNLRLRGEPKEPKTYYLYDSVIKDVDELARISGTTGPNLVRHALNELLEKQNAINCSQSRRNEDVPNI